MTTGSEWATFRHKLEEDGRYCVCGIDIASAKSLRVHGAEIAVAWDDVTCPKCLKWKPNYANSEQMDYCDPDHDLPAYTGPPAAIAPVRRQAWTWARAVRVMTLVAIYAAIVAALCCGWVLVTMCLEMQP